MITAKRFIVHLLATLPLYIGVVLIHESYLRDVYEREVAQIPQQAYQLQSSGYSLEEATRWAIDKRNDMKEFIRNEGSPINKRLAELRNTTKYGNPVGPNYDMLVKSVKKNGYLHPEEVHHKIIEGSGKSNAAVNSRADMHWITGSFLILLSIGVGAWSAVKTSGSALVQWMPQAMCWLGALIGGMFGVEIGAFLGEWLSGEHFLLEWGIGMGIAGSLSIGWLLKHEANRIVQRLGHSSLKA